MKKNQKRRNRYSAVIIIVIMVSLTSIFSIQILQRAEQTVVEKNKIAYTTFENYIDQIAKLIVAISQLENIQNTEIPLGERALFLRPFQEQNDLLMLAVMDENGNASSSLLGGFADLSDRDYFSEVKETKKMVVSDVLISRTTGTENIVIVQPIIKENEFKGAVFASISIDSISKFVDLHSNTGEGYQTYIIQNDGEYITTAPQGSDFEEETRAQKRIDTFNTGVYLTEVQKEMRTNFTVVTELNIITYYKEVWILLVAFLMVLLMLLIALIRILNKQHQRQLLPLVTQLNQDDLTKVANRKFFEYEVKQWLEVYQYGVFIILDLDHFKAVNDTLGHRVGDQLLIETAAQLTKIFRKQDIVARLGGDEFVIFIPGVISKAILLERVAEVLDKLTKTYKHQDGEISVTASLGVVVVNESWCKYEEIYEAADAALYEVKNKGVMVGLLNLIRKRLLFIHQ